jgi:hypothetical protein
MRICIGWIPNLTGNIFLKNPFEDSRFSEIKHYRDIIPLNEYGWANNDFNVYVKKKETKSFEQKDVLIFIYFVKKNISNEPIEIKIFEENKPRFKKICTIKKIIVDKGGLIQFEAETNFEQDTYHDSSYEKWFIEYVFLDIRDLYHEHTHHDADPDVCELVYNTKTKKEGINEIIKNFQRKIIVYSHVVKGIQRSKGADPSQGAMDTLKMCNAEFIHALNFLEYYKRDIRQEYKKYVQIFENAIRSCEATNAEINAKIQFNSFHKSEDLTSDISRLTWIVAIGTIILIVLELYTLHVENPTEIADWINIPFTWKF